MKSIRLLTFLLFVFLVGAVHGQQYVDSTLIKAFPFKIGNIGFAIDSLEFVIGDIARGETVHHEVAIHNFGKQPISFKSGKVSKFVEMNYNPGVLSPGQSGTAIIDYEVIRELPLGITMAEIAVETNDKISPYKFIYLIGNVTDNASATAGQLIIDSVPRMIFNQYNYDFGHLAKGKSVVHTFVFTNRGSEDLIIDEINASEGCSILAPPNAIIPPGEDGAVVVKIRTMGNFGVQHRTVIVKSNDPVNPSITLGVHGTVRVQAPSKLNPDFCYE